MRTCRLVPIWSLLATLFSGAALAQNPAPAAEPAPAAGSAASAAGAKLPDPETITDAAVLAILETKPETPAELVRAASTLADLGQPLWAREYLRRLMAAKPQAAALAELADRYPSEMLIRMAGNPELQPEAKKVVDAIFAASKAQLQDGGRIQALTKQLESPETSARQEALSRLRQGGDPAVLELLKVLRDPARQNEYPAVRGALARLGGPAVGPLVAALDSGDPRLAVEVLRALRAMNARGALADIIYLAVAPEASAEMHEAAQSALKAMLNLSATPQDAARFLAKESRLYYNRRGSVASHAGEATVWEWDKAKDVPVSRAITPEAAARRLAARLAERAYALVPGDPALELLHLGTLLESASYECGLNRPLPTDAGTPADRAAKHGVAAVESLLAEALRDDRAVVATAASQILGTIGRADELVLDSGSPRPLVEATRYGDRRVRMAAIGAIMQLDPQVRFAGSSQIPMGLEFFASTGGTRRVLVACPIDEASRELATIFRQLGYETDTADDGREALDLLHSAPDYELVLLDVGIDMPTSDLLIQQFRKHSRTADLRVLLSAREGFFPRAEQVAARDRLTVAVHRPHDEAAVRWQIRRVMAIEPEAFVAHEERQAQAAQALEWWIALTDRSDDVYAIGPLEEFNLRKVQAAVVNPLYVPELTDRVVGILGNLGTHESQRTLVELASRESQPLEVRRAALAALGRNVERNGILLTTGEISRQYDRYNASEFLEPATQRILSSVLDYIELPTLALRPPQEEEADQAKPE